LIHLDTHAVVWAHQNRRRLSQTARRRLQGPCAISPAVFLEIEGLFELRRVAEDAATIISVLGRTVSLEVAQTPFIEIVSAARTFAWTHDPFDRLIVANAMVEGVPLLTADGRILDNFKDAIW
jgi:PIN domain nuclease of toxin-antitoxin system